MNSARVAGLWSLGALVGGILLSFVLGAASGGDPAGEAMLTGLLGFGAVAIAFVIAIVAFVLSFKQKPLDRVTAYLSRGPLILFVVLLVFGVLLAVANP